jgi:putative transposase
MPRQSRIVIPGCAHHVTQRGNYGVRVFESDRDHAKYCSLINQYAEKYSVKILCYCLMTNHVHFLVIPATENALARMFNTAHMRYSQHKNMQKGEKGHLWQGRFFSCVMDEGHVMRAMRYVERNPVRAKMVKKVEEYRWSSAGSHVGVAASDILLRQGPITFTAAEWRRYLEAEDKTMYAEMKLKTQKGLPIGSESFVEKLQTQLKRVLIARGAGRPFKDSSK